MGIDVRWLDREHRVILRTVTDGWTWEDLWEILDIEMQMMDTVDHRVDVLTDGRDLVLPDGALKIMSSLSNRAATLNHPNGGSDILVGLSQILKRFADIYTSVFKQHSPKMIIANTMEEAFEIAGITRGDLL